MYNLCFEIIRSFYFFFNWIISEFIISFQKTNIIACLKLEETWNRIYVIPESLCKADDKILNSEF